MGQDNEKYSLRWDVDTYESIRTDILESLPFEYPGKMCIRDRLWPGG